MADREPASDQRRASAEATFSELKKQINERNEQSSKIARKLRAEREQKQVAERRRRDES
jgi:hypothetical protein